MFFEENDVFTEEDFSKKEIEIKSSSPSKAPYYVKLKPNYDANLEIIQKCQKEAFRHLSYLNQLKITLKDVKDTPPYLEIDDIYINTLKNFDILGNLFVKKSKEGCIENHCDDDYIFKCNDDFTLRKEYLKKKPESDIKSDVSLKTININININTDKPKLPLIIPKEQIKPINMTFYSNSTTNINSNTNIYTRRSKFSKRKSNEKLKRSNKKFLKEVIKNLKDF